MARIIHKMRKGFYPRLFPSPSLSLSRDSAGEGEHPSQYPALSFQEREWKGKVM